MLKSDWFTTFCYLVELWNYVWKYVLTPSSALSSHKQKYAQIGKAKENSPWNTNLHHIKSQDSSNKMNSMKYTDPVDVSQTGANTVRSENNPQ